MKRKLIILVIIFGLLFIAMIIAIALEIPIANKEAKQGFSELLPLEMALSPEDSAIFPSKYWTLLKVNVVHRSKVRQNISLIHFKDQYNILMYKIPLKTDTFSLLHSIKVQQRSISKTLRYSYNIVEDDLNYKFDDLIGKPPLASELMMTFYGDTIKTIIVNDSVFSFHSLCKSLALKYDEAKPIDIFIDSREGFLGKRVAIPMDFMLLKKQNFVYLIVMTPKNFDKGIPPGILYKIISGTLTK